MRELMGKHLRVGIITTALALTFLLIFATSLGVKSSVIQMASDNTFDFTPSAGPTIAGTATKLLTDRRETAPPASGSLWIDSSPYYWSTNQYPSTGSTADTTVTWSITLVIASVVGSPSGCAAQVLIVDSSFNTINSVTAVSFTATVGTQTITFGSWTTQQSDYPINNYYIMVKFTATTIGPSDKWKLAYGSTRSTLNTGYVIPEEFLVFLPAAIAIPIVVGKWVNRRKKP